MTRRGRGRLLSMLLSACLLAGGVPAEPFGGMGKAAAREIEGASGVVYTEGDWSVSTGDAAYEYRQVKWDFTTAGLTESLRISEGDSVQGVKALRDKVYLKKGTEGLSISSGGGFLIPLDERTSSVGVTLQLSSNNSSRFLLLGEQTTQKIYHSSSAAAERGDGIAFDGNRACYTDLDSSYFTQGEQRGLSVTTGTIGTDGKDESKLAVLELIENRPRAGLDEEPELVRVSGTLQGLDAELMSRLRLRFLSDKIYMPACTIHPETGTYEAELEKGVSYRVEALGIDDYSLLTTQLAADHDGEAGALVFEAKPLYPVTIYLKGVQEGESARAVYTFTRVGEEAYVYTFDQDEPISLRDGQYRVTVTLDGYEQQPAADVKVEGRETVREVVMKPALSQETVEYRSELKVGEGEAFRDINSALEAVRHMERDAGQRVTLLIRPGNYEEMLVIDVPNVTLKNASSSPGTGLINRGVDIEEEAVRITSYYGHGYTYYSMGADCKYNEALLAANRENGYPSFVNPGSGTTAGSYWNATVVVKADGFEAEGIIFENSFNQYVSAKAAQDVIVKQAGAREGAVPRATMSQGDTTVQNKAYVERAAALAMGNSHKDIVFTNCKFVGRQDTLYGGKGTYAEFRECSVYGATDYIFGGMTAIFDGCDLVFNTSDDRNDVGYITAAQQAGGRGYLMLNCHITSTVPGVDTASAYPSKPGYLGRPWAADTSEVVFFRTTIDAADAYWESEDANRSKTWGKSLIVSEGWSDSLKGTSPGMCEYGTRELAADYTPQRVAWAGVLEEPLLADGTPITADAFRRDTGNGRREWSFAAFGSSTNTDDNGYSGHVDKNTLTLWSENGKGKLVPASTDGVAFYYTEIDPSKENFTLSATIETDRWKYSNGQEGFGLMAADAVGKNGDGASFWNNSYMASVTKVEYQWDSAEKKLTDAGAKYTMKLGIGAQEKVGVTPENLAEGKVTESFSSRMTALETSCAEQGLDAGTYNIAGNYTNEKLGHKDGSLKTSFRLSIQRNNTGYFVSYTDENGVIHTQKYYHEGGDALTVLDQNRIYVGFFASRNARIKIKDVQLTTIDPGEDAPAEERPASLVTPEYSILSAGTSNSPDYRLVYYGNAQGRITITDEDGNFLAKEEPVEALTKKDFAARLKSGKNEFSITFAPNADYRPSKYEALSSYDAVSWKFSVTYRESKAGVVYISPEGRADGEGSREKPLSLEEAVKYAQPGQQLVLMEGVYKPGHTLIVERGIDGTKDKPIVLMADPKASSMPVLDFEKKSAGLVLAGDYWYLQGFGVTGSADGQKGIQVSGSHNVLDGLYTYKNGNTGIQISRYLLMDTREEWPADNLILNCTSYLNADAGYEDADGFAAKLTVGEGNVFDGCIAAYNADDGWDLFAKVETGAIGRVVIRNSVAFKNGYVLDEAGREVEAGNGNGFKMGGSSITGRHELRDSIAFANKAKGIDSNSCPDIRVYGCTSFNNQGANVAFYTTDAADTDFYARGILSVKDERAQTEKGKKTLTVENIKLKGTQEADKVYDATNYYVLDTAPWSSSNSMGAAVSAEWFESTDMEAAVSLGFLKAAGLDIAWGSRVEPLYMAADGEHAARVTVQTAKAASGAGSAGQSASAGQSSAGGIGRNKDGSINMNGFLTLTDKAPAGVGAVLKPVSSKAPALADQSSGEGKEDPGTTNQESSTNNTSDSTNNNTGNHTGGSAGNSPENNTGSSAGSHTDSATGNSTDSSTSSKKDGSEGAGGSTVKSPVTGDAGRAASPGRAGLPVWLTLTLILTAALVGGVGIYTVYKEKKDEIQT